MDLEKGLKLSKKRALHRLFQTVLIEIKPTRAEVASATEYSNELMGRLKALMPKNVEIILVGSVARGTQIRGNADIDIFLLFPKTLPERRMESQAISIAKKIVYKHKNESYVINYAEHPYLRLISQDKQLFADIVPAFKISDAQEMGSAVDRTQLHNKFITKNLSKEQCDDVRMLKYFLRAHNIYGAEAKISGFSGYLCELLVYHYGTFLNLLLSLDKAKLPLLIDAKSKNEIRNSKEVELLTKKFSSRFVVIDPTDPDRNVAANVSEEALARLVFAARNLLKSPTKDQFEPVRYSDVRTMAKLDAIRKKYGIDLYAMHFKVPKISEDIIVPQLKRLKANMVGIMSKQRMEPLLALHNLHEKNALIAFFTNHNVSESVVSKGPSAFIKDGSNAFYKKHLRDSNIFIEGERLFSLERAAHPSPRELLLDLLKDKSVFPSYINPKQARLYVNKMPEEYASLVYKAYIEKMYL